MIGLVIVSHSAKLAEGVCELAGQVAEGKVRLAAAGGTGNPDNPIGTDSFRVLEAIESVYSEDGVLVLMDLGSAVLSAETAVDLLDEERRSSVRLCPAPLVEGAVAAVSQAAAGAGLEEVVREAHRAMAAKETHLGSGSPEQAASDEGTQDAAESAVLLPNPLGLHARPAAQLVRRARWFRARITVENLTAAAGPVDAGSINGVLSLGARQNHQLRIRAQGQDSRKAVAALTSFLASGCGESVESPGSATADPTPEPADSLPGQLTGIAASPGIAAGPLVRLKPAAMAVSKRLVDDPEDERRRLSEAIAKAQEDTRALYEWARRQAGTTEAGIFDAQSLFLEDPALAGEAERIILSEQCNAEYAWQAAAERASRRLAELADPYLRSRAVDAGDVANRVLHRLTGCGKATAVIAEPSVVAAYDLTPSEVKELNLGLVAGLCLEAGSGSAHSVILARAVGIPAVVGLGRAISALEPGTTVALDGERGVVWVEPGPRQLSALENRRQERLAARGAALEERRKPAFTRDGRRIRVVANISGVAEAVEALECGAEGVGVLRTEFLFLGRETAPSEEEQLSAYSAIAASLGDRPLCIRTLDVGGDKSLPYIAISSETNPFLGLRGIRLTLQQRSLLRTQLRAILRAAVGHPVEALFPMLSTLAELREAKAVLLEAANELDAEGVSVARGIKVGAMIEVPAAAAIADQLAREAAFFSIGTNDLVQYVMAADRTNSSVAAIADPFQPAVLRMIHQTVQAGRRAGINVALCGEFAANTLAVPLLLGMGLEELSVSPPFVPEVKQAIRRWDFPAAESVARHALELDSSESVRQYLATVAG